MRKYGTLLFCQNINFYTISNQEILLLGIYLIIFKRKWVSQFFGQNMEIPGIVGAGGA